MPTTHVVQRGDCIESISLRYGFFAEDLWQHEENEALRKLRGDPHVLQAGDEVFIPDLRVKRVPAATGAVHRFRRRGVPAQFRLILREGGEPRSGVDYKLVVGGRTFVDTTGPTGLIQHWIEPDATTAELTIDDEVIVIRLGHLPPLTDPEGVAARLENLGYDFFRSDPLSLRAAIVWFQTDQSLTVTGEADEATCARLDELHGS